MRRFFKENIMSKRKKMYIIVSILLALILSVSGFFGIRACVKNQSPFSVADTLPDGQGKKATVILLGGQSNASGCSRDEYLAKNVSTDKYAQYEKGFDNVYINYFASELNQSKSFVKCATKQGEAGGFFGPELGMADKLNEMYPDELFFIIKYAWGATDLFNLWLSPSSKGKTGDLYNAFTQYVKTSMKYLISKNYEVEIEGMCWMQGESDSFSVENATNYQQHLDNFITDIRKEFSRYTAKKDTIAFIDAYIADNPVYWVYCDLVNASKKAVAEKSPFNVLIDTVAEGLTCAQEPAEDPDLAHYDSLSEIKLGHLFIEHLSPFLS